MIMAGLVFAITIAAVPPEFEKSHDRFNGITEIFTSTNLDSSTFITVAGFYKGKEFGENSIHQYRLSFWAHGKDWRYLRCHGVSMLADDVPVDLPESTHDGRVLSHSVSESVTLKIERSVLEAIANSKTSEVRICGDEWKIPQKMKSLVKRILDDMTPRKSEP